MKKVHYDIHVSGKVQGVWFRKYTKIEADKLGLKGFVRNEPDGKVYIEAEGEEALILDFIGWLHIGAPLSKVKNVAYETANVVGFESFDISA